MLNVLKYQQTRLKFKAKIYLYHLKLDIKKCGLFSYRAVGINLTRALFLRFTAINCFLAQGRSIDNVGKSMLSLCCVSSLSLEDTVFSYKLSPQPVLTHVLVELHRICIIQCNIQLQWIYTENILWL